MSDASREQAGSDPRMDARSEQHEFEEVSQHDDRGVSMLDVPDFGGIPLASSPSKSEPQRRSQDEVDVRRHHNLHMSVQYAASEPGDALAYVPPCRVYVISMAFDGSGSCHCTCSMRNN